MTDGSPGSVGDEGAVPLHGVGVSSPETAVFLDLKSIELDLRHAAIALTQVAETDGATDGLTRRALSDSASIAYRRGFTTGKSLVARTSRARVPDDIIAGLSDDERKIHDEILEQANQHIAHRVLPHEQGATVVLLSNPDIYEKAFVGVSGFIVRWNSATDEDARACADVAAKVADGIALAIKDVEKTLLEHAEATGLDWFYANAHLIDGSN